jgi:hypothetical protein
MGMRPSSHVPCERPVRLDVSQLSVCRTASVRTCYSYPFAERRPFGRVTVIRLPNGVRSDVLFMGPWVKHPSMFLSGLLPSVDASPPARLFAAGQARIRIAAWTTWHTDLSATLAQDLGL